MVDADADVAYSNENENYDYDAVSPNPNPNPSPSLDRRLNQYSSLRSNEEVRMKDKDSKSTRERADATREHKSEVGDRIG